MADFFNEMLNGDIELDTTENEIVTEDTSINFPYNRSIKRKIILPKGEPTGKGMLCYLYSNSIDESINTINNALPIFRNLIKIKSYYYNLRYNGRVYNKVYRFYDMDIRRDIYERVHNELSLQGKLNLSNNKLSTYFELSKYLTIFESICGNLPVLKYMNLYWEYLSAIVNEDIPNYNKKNRFMLIDMKNFKFGKDLKDNIKNPLFIIYYTMYKGRTDLLKDINLDIYFINGEKILKLNPSMLSKEINNIKALDIKIQISKLIPGYNSNIEDEELEEENIKKEEIADNVAKVTTAKIFSNGNGGFKIITSDNDLRNMKAATADNVAAKKVENIVKKKVDENEDIIKNLPEKDASKIIEKDVRQELEEEKSLLANEYYKDRNVSKAKSSASIARDIKIRKDQANLTVGDIKISDLEKLNIANTPTPVTDISNVVDTSNENVKDLKFINHDKTYENTLMKKDIVDAVLSLNDKPIPMYIIKINVEDTSTEFDLKDTYSITLEDANRKRHIVKIDMPKFIENKFLYLGGNYKILKHQNMLLPVIKTSESTVQIISNYSKMTISRSEAKSLTYIEKFKKIVNRNEEYKSYFVLGASIANNKKYLTGIEYDELSKVFISFKKGKCNIMFSQVDATDYAKKHNIEVPDNKFFIGTDSKGENILIDMDDQLDDKDRNILDIIMEAIGGDIISEFGSMRNGKKSMVASVRIMEKNVNVGWLLCLWCGLSELLKKLKLDYRLEKRIPTDLKTNEDYIKFKDCVLIYKTDVTKSLILNGLPNTSNYELDKFDTKEPLLNYLLSVYGNINVENALFNFYDFFIDPITKEVLLHESMPTEIVDLVIYGIKLLADSQYVSEINENFYRVRMGETLPAIMYKELASAYVLYKNTNGRRAFSVPRDCVMKSLLKLPNIEDYSTLNPVLEMEQLHGISNKGFRGVNLDESYTPAKRVFDKSAIGIMSPSTSPDANVGIAKQLTMEPNITSIRGYIEDYSDDLDKLKDVNLFSPGELTIPLGSTVDDPTRLGHAMKQSRQTIPVVDSSPVLISNGVEETVRFQVSSSFAINAEESGEIIDYNDELKIMIAKYKSGKCRAIDLKPTMVKNSGGGFYLSNELVTDLKVGDKFKANQVLAYHKNFFTNSKFNACRMNIGTLTKIAITTSYDTYEDATFITESLSKRASTEMCFKKNAIVGKNANVFYMAKKGSEIKIGEPLIEFDNSYDDSSINELLRNLGLDEDSKDTSKVLENSRNRVNSKYSGIIEDIKIYSTVDLEELSPSLKPIVNNYYKEINKKNKYLDKFSNDTDNEVYKCGILMRETSHKTIPNKFGVVHGEKLNDEVLIEFYIKHSEPLEVGSKIANFTALKNTICEIVPKGYEPYSEFRPEEEVSTFIASNSILARMTPSIVLTAFGNKCIIELKNKLKELFPDRKKMESLIYKFFTAFDKTGSNTKKYKALFTPMNDAKFKQYFTEFFKDEKAYLVLDIVDYERNITMADIEKAAAVLNVPLYEHVYIPHITMDKSKVVVTKEKVPVGYIPIKRTQQTVMKKNGLSTEISKRSALTGQVTGKDKNGRESDLENIGLIAMGLKNTLKELNSARADDSTMKQEMLQSINTNGYCRLDELTDDITNKVTLNTVDTYLRGMGLFSDLVTKGILLPKTIEDEF